MWNGPNSAYFAVTAGYVPPLVKGMKQGFEKIEAKRKGAANDVPLTPRKFSPLEKAVGTVLFLIFVMGVGAAAPVLTAGSVSGIIGLLIIFWGLQQAWKQTARDPRLLMGPYQVEDSAPQV